MIGTWNKILFAIVPKVKELLEINLTKHVQVLYPENYKTLLTEVKNEDLSKCHHGLEDSVSLRCVLSPDYL